MLGRRILRSFVGFVTCTLVVVLIMFILWPTIDIIPLVEAHDYLVDPIGFLPMFSELNIDQSFAIGNKFGNAGLYFLILGIWLVGSFAGGLVSRGGLRAGSTSATLSFIFLDVVFSIMAVSFDWNIAGISGFLLFFVMFFFTLVIGSFVFVGIIGLIGGGIGGILGKMLFTKDTKDKKE